MKKIFNNDLSIKNVDEKLEVFGWVSKKRDLGGVIFIDLRDRSGIVQLVVNPDNPYYEVASEIKSLLGINLISNVVKAIYIAGVRIVIKNPTNRNNLVIDTFKGN